MAQLTGSRWHLQVKRWVRKLEINRKCSSTTSPWTKEVGGTKSRRRILDVLRLEMKPTTHGGGPHWKDIG
jgi:hypothetical protein